MKGIKASEQSHKKSLSLSSIDVLVVAAVAVTRMPCNTVTFVTHIFKKQKNLEALVGFVLRLVTSYVECPLNPRSGTHKIETGLQSSLRKVGFL